MFWVYSGLKGVNIFHFYIFLRKISESDLRRAKTRKNGEFWRFSISVKNDHFVFQRYYLVNKIKIKHSSRPFCRSGRYISISVISFFLPLVKRRPESFKITAFSAIFSIHLKLTAKIRKKSKICIGQFLGNFFVVSTSYRTTSWLLGRAQTNI